ncbi:MAG: hypothetical protein EWM51_03160 [Treponema sp.]|nr:MAG: hypothetical protein EWM51_03160 [Treponema sp.]
MRSSGVFIIEVNTVNYHLKKIFSDSELEEISVIRNFRITAADGKTYDTILRKIACTRATYSSHVTKCEGCEIWITR